MGVRFAEADGIIDLGTDSGRLAARILIAVAKAEQERKSERQKLANEAAAISGKRRLGTPRPFGYCEDHVTAHPAEGRAVADACAALLGGGTLSGVMREWTRAGVRAGPVPGWAVEPDVDPDDPAEPADRRAVGVPWPDRRPGGLGAGSGFGAPAFDARISANWGGFGSARLTAPVAVRTRPSGRRGFASAG